MRAIRATATLYQRLREVRAPASLTRHHGAAREALAYLDAVAEGLPRGRADADDGTRG